MLIITAYGNAHRNKKTTQQLVLSFFSFFFVFVFSSGVCCHIRRNRLDCACHATHRLAQNASRGRCFNFSSQKRKRTRVSHTIISQCNSCAFHPPDLRAPRSREILCRLSHIHHASGRDSFLLGSHEGKRIYAMHTCVLAGLLRLHRVPRLRVPAQACRR